MQREIFKRLGDIVYSIWGGGDPAVALEELTRDFVDQTAFMQYFTSTWVPKIGYVDTILSCLHVISKFLSREVEN